MKKTRQFLRGKKTLQVRKERIFFSQIGVFGNPPSFRSKEKKPIRPCSTDFGDHFLSPFLPIFFLQDADTKFCTLRLPLCPPLLFCAYIHDFSSFSFSDGSATSPRRATPTRAASRAAAPGPGRRMPRRRRRRRVRPTEACPWTNPRRPRPNLPRGPTPSTTPRAPPPRLPLPRRRAAAPRRLLSRRPATTTAR